MQVPAKKKQSIRFSTILLKWNKEEALEQLGRQSSRRIHQVWKLPRDRIESKCQGPIERDDADQATPYERCRISVTD